ncbi:MAG TPA: cytochrome b/b6 domain-containing protein [Blastocatellia bacterium]|nr:cytochrome b/b6 domain-containing protein [Blastocatellia bacterium]
MNIQKRIIMLAAALLCFVLWASHTLTPSLRAHAEQAPAEEMTSADCLACHNDSSLEKEVDGKKLSMHVSEGEFSASVHGSLDCKSCHSDVNAYPHDPTPARVSCAECHTEASEKYDHGLHAKAVQNGSSNAASCLACHGNAHRILASSDPKSKTSRTSIAQTCGACHGVKFVMEGTGLTSRPFLAYQESVHGRAVTEGRDQAAVCTDCHNSHDIRTAADAQSPIFKFNVPATCGKCHSDVQKEFAESIHGQAISRGNSQSPVCTDCHGIHAIKPHIDPGSPVAAQAVARTTCAKCHEGVRLSDEFGVEGKRVSSYLDSYHGLASRLGSTVVANCASCHGVHNILPSTDPHSTISKNNLVETCGKCHPGASENFALSQVHLDSASADRASVISGWVRSIYLWLIIGVIGFMLAHNGLAWHKKAKAARMAPDRTITRMNLNQRVQHWLLLSSFTVLVITGFALAYPDSWLAYVLGSNETIRSAGHRIAAIVMIGVGIYHVFYMTMTREGRQGLRDFLPRLKDFRDLVQTLLYYTGRRSDRPKIARFGYGEKIEYWAVIWGTIVMGITGLMLWFKIDAFGFLPRWIIDVALAVHFYEAVLATLAIIVWHLYHVIFDPDLYPINWAFLDGRISEKLYRREHELHYEELIAAESRQQHQAPPSGENKPTGEKGSDLLPAGSASD